MAPGAGAGPVRLSIAAYRVAVRLLPAKFRSRFGGELVATFADMARERHAHDGLVGLARLWAQAAHDVLFIFRSTCSARQSFRDLPGPFLRYLSSAGPWR